MSDSPDSGCQSQSSPKEQVATREDSSSEDKSGRDYTYRKLIQQGNSKLDASTLDPQDEGTPDEGIERNLTMVRLTGKHPFNAEPPLSRLMQHGFITPVPLHYVRNHGPVTRANWEDWTVEVCPLDKPPVQFTMDKLEKEFQSREFPVTLVCAGNRRREQNMVKRTLGFNWGAAGVSTSVWLGVLLRDVFERCGILGLELGALNVCFEGAEDLPGGGGSKYGTSIKYEIAMDPARDIMLAYKQNGERLSPDHGFPVRMIIPGFIGGRMVKWLKRIIVTTQESNSYYHYNDNRVLPSHVDPELANAEAWWKKPEYIINELNINSVITTPCHEESLTINWSTTQRPYTLRGYAYSGGGRKVTRVEITIDGGEKWRVCTLEHLEKPNKYGKYWCWCFWSLEVELLDLLGAKEIAVRAWDEALNTQPEKLIWNVLGMMNNCWFRVKTNVCKLPDKEEIGIVFEHPTLPGNQSGGWMAKEKPLETSNQSPSMNMSSKKYSMSEVEKHNSPESAWIIVHGHIYDCTRFINDHPGGAYNITSNAGTDCTQEFGRIHSDKAKKELENYRIGELITTDYASDSAPKIFPCMLVSKKSISHDVRLFRFALPSRNLVLGLPVGKHIFLYATIDDKMHQRAYTPTSPIDEVGYFELVVKIYFKYVHPKFPNGGLMSQHLNFLPMGSVLNVEFPFGNVEYTGRGKFLVHGESKFAKRLAMVAGGTGITPIYQVVQAILKDPEDETQMYVVYANRTEDDILLREKLDGWAEKHGHKLKVWYVVKKSESQGWQYSVGSINETILREHVPEGSGDTLALACGPLEMIQEAVKPNLEKMNYDINNALIVF